MSVANNEGYMHKMSNNDSPSSFDFLSLSDLSSELNWTTATKCVAKGRYKVGLVVGKEGYINEPR